jgi:hypothetical protein
MDQPAEDALAASAAAESEALTALEQHHAGMLKRLNAMAATLIRAVQSGDAVAGHEAHEVLVEWCETELVPHALAEENNLYAPPRNMPQAELLVAGLLADHQMLVRLLEELRGSAGVAAAVAAGALRTVFALHLEKEDRLLFPLIVAAPGLSLARSVEGQPELLGEIRVHPPGPGSAGSV